MNGNDGRNSFSLAFHYFAGTPCEAWVTGLTLNSTDHAGINVSGLALGETTLGDVLAACGPDYHGHTTDSNRLTCYTFNISNAWNLEFDGSNPNAKLTKLTASSDLLTSYGIVDTSKAGIREDGLSDPTTMAFNQFILDSKLYSKGDTVQKLLDNGWVLPSSHKADSSIAAIEGNRMSGDSFLLYNGVSMVKIYAYNPTAKACPLSDCQIHQVTGSIENHTDRVCADGLQPGVSTDDEAVATLGEPTSASEKSGLTEYKFTVINSVTYALLVDESGTVVSIDIRGLI